MKLIIYIFSCFFLFSACNKEENSKSASPNNQILRIATDSAVTAKLCYELEIPLVAVPISQHPIPKEL